jgi:hypothetical protein
MDLGLWVMGLIIAIDLVIVAAILHWGSKHDTHTSIRSVESSRAVQTLLAQREGAPKKAAQIRQPESSAEDA